ncbi:MAG: ATP-dependent metallopeptidase FtsH/Yme1/Tma family protein, partial [Caulobacteraceae bacterium]|nr:ATP-dependent metallopeptidase FtsH/Yme1/Tma family protein [Caulobacteraceae bacterium]
MNLRNLAIWGVIGVVMLGLYGVVTQTTHAPAGGELSYSSLLKEVDAGHVKRAVIHNDSVDAGFADGKTVTVTTPYNQDDLIHRLDASGADVSVKSANGITALGVLVQLLPVILIIAMTFLIMRQMQGGARGAMGFGKSKARLLTENKNRVTFDDVTG